MQSSLGRLDILLGALQVLNEEPESLGLRVSWVKTKIQAFNNTLDAAFLSVPVCEEDIEVTDRFITLAVIFMSPVAMSQRSIDVWVGPGCHRFTGSWGVVLSVAVQEDKSPSLQVLCASSLALWM